MPDKSTLDVIWTNDKSEAANELVRSTVGRAPRVLETRFAGREEGELTWQNDARLALA
jgi:hypothetical protein